MSDFVCLRSYIHSLEAELARNFLESQGIRATLSAGDAGGTHPALSMYQGGYVLLVHPDDVKQAEELLKDEGQVVSDISEQEKEELAQEENAQQEAKKEFEEMKTMELQQKAESVNSNGIVGIVLLVVGIVLIVISAGRNLFIKGGIACILGAVIQYFVWKDALNAKKMIQKDSDQ